MEVADHCSATGPAAPGPRAGLARLARTDQGLALGLPAMAGCLTAAEAREQWEPIVAQWETGLEAERAASLARTSLLPVDSPAAAVELDDWVCRHREPVDLDDLPHPVSGQLQRMDPLRELLHLAGTRRALLAAHAGPPPTALLARISDRERALSAALQAWSRVRFRLGT
jgi:hypothetical protein